MYEPKHLTADMLNSLRKYVEACGGTVPHAMDSTPEHELALRNLDREFTNLDESVRKSRLTYDDGYKDGRSDGRSEGEDDAIERIHKALRIPRR